MELPCDGTLCQRMIFWDMYMGILWVHKGQEPEIMALWLQDMFIGLGFIPEAAKLLIREQELDSPEARQKKCWCDAQQRVAGEPEVSHLPTPS